jgi:hypothetical protein
LTDSRLELLLVHQAVAVGVDQPRDTTFHLLNQALRLGTPLGPLVGCLIVEAPLVLRLQPAWLLQQRTNVVPDRLLQQVRPHLLILAETLATEPIRVRPRAAVVGVVARRPLGRSATYRLSIVGIAALGADQ